MGRIAHALRANLRERAQADARMVRERVAVLPAMAQPPPGTAGHLSDGLDRLSVRDWKALCKDQGFKGCTSLNKTALIQTLRGGDPPSATTNPAPSGLSAIEARLDRMKVLLR